MHRVFICAAAFYLALASNAVELPAQGPTRNWAQWGGSGNRNAVGHVTRVPLDFRVGDFERATGNWLKETSRHIRWVAPLGSQSYGSPIVAEGRVFISTNNGHGHLKRFPPEVDLGVLLCFSADDGKLLWQYSAQKLRTGRKHDWPMQGIVSSPVVEGERLWLVTNRCEVVCLDVRGYADMEDDGPEKLDRGIAPDDVNEADVVWKLDMMADLGVSPHNMSTCSPTLYKDVLFICTSNGVDESHVKIPAPDAPSFIALDKRTGELLWSDNSPGKNILHGQWSSPSVAVLGGVPQVLFGGGDGWLYSFGADIWKDGKPELLWKFDANPKESKWNLGGRGTRNEFITTPAICNGRVYFATGQDAEHGEGVGHLWCIDPTKRGDVSAELAVLGDAKTIIPHRREQAVDAARGELAIANPNSAVIWHYRQFDRSGDGKIDFEEQFHRSINTPVIEGNLLFAPDFSGLVHCLDAHTGKPHWVCDLEATTWGSPTIVNDHVLVGDEDGDVAIFRVSADAKLSLSDERSPLHEINMNNSIYGSPTVAGNTIYIATRTHLVAIDAAGAANRANAERGPTRRGQ
jgi:outer membrane protein assembly factor BamB